VREILFPLVFVAALLKQAVHTPDAFKQAETDRLIELVD